MFHARADSISFIAAALRMCAGILVWAAHFAILYGFTGLACARRLEESGAVWVGLIPWVIGLATVIAAAAAAVLLVPVVRAPSKTPFVEWVSGWTAAFALVAILLEAAAVFWVPWCG
jgi:hypothetical protein